MQSITYETLLVTSELGGEVVFVTLNQPKTSNALSRAMVRDIHAVLDRLEASTELRAVIFRGAGGTFCAGGNIADFDAHRCTPHAQNQPDPVVRTNREAGAFLLRIRRLPAVVIAAIEGAAIGGGMGVACVSDIAIASAETKFAMSESRLGVTPAQISAFVTERIGLSQALRLAVTGERIDATEAHRIGLVHRLAADAAALERALDETLDQVLRCAPGANRVTKEIFLATAELPLTRHLDWAAERFALCLRSDEGREGVRAYLDKRPASWVRKREQK